MMKNKENIVETMQKEKVWCTTGKYLNICKFYIALYKNKYNLIRNTINESSIVAVYIFFK